MGERREGGRVDIERERERDSARAHLTLCTSFDEGGGPCNVRQPFLALMDVCHPSITIIIQQVVLLGLPFNLKSISSPAECDTNGMVSI